MYNYGDYEINYQRRFPPWDGVIFPVFLSQNHIIWKKYDIKLINLISMYHLKPLVSLDRFIKFKMRMYKLLVLLIMFRSFA